MTALLLEILGSWTRIALAAATAYLVDHHIVTADQGGRLDELLYHHIFDFAPIVIAMIWAWWKNYWSKVKLHTALQMPAGSSIKALQSRIKSGLGESAVRAAALLLVAVLGSSVIACSRIHTNVSPVADVANAGGKLQETVHEIFNLAKQQNATTNPLTGRPVLSRDALDQVAIVVNKVGHLGLDLKTSLDAYNAANASGGDATAAQASVKQALDAITQALADLGHAVPAGTVRQIDDLARAAVGLVSQLKGAVGL